jgi:4-hydroxy-tetrahydrodipicolinate synthase
VVPSMAFCNYEEIIVAKLGKFFCNFVRFYYAINTHTMNKDLVGVLPALATPLNSDGSFDEAGMRRLVRFTLDNGMKTLFVLGYAGEVLTFDRSTRRRIIETVRDEAGPNIPLIAGVCDNSLELISNHIKDACDCGANYVLTTPVDFYYYRDDEIETLFTSLAHISKVPIIIYNCPEVKYKLSAQLLAKLSTNPNICAVKETSNINNLQKIMFALPPDADFTIMSGEEFIYLPAMSIGIKSFIMGGPGNILPDKCVSILEAFNNGEFERATSEYLSMIRFLYELYSSFDHTEMASIKAVLELYGLCSRRMRAPVRSASDESMKKIAELLDKHNIRK